jgi:hypothetical protein
MDLPRFHVVEIFPKGRPFNATHYIEDILQQILELPPKSFRDRLIIHADNARSHIIRQSQQFYEQNSLRIAPYPSYSLDLTPSYCFPSSARKVHAPACPAGFSSSAFQSTYLSSMDPSKS